VPSKRGFLALFLLAFAEADARAPAVLVDEFDAGFLEGQSQYSNCRRAGFRSFALEQSNSSHPYMRTICELLLSPIKQTSGCSALGWGEHAPSRPEAVIRVNFIVFRLTCVVIVFILF
jgi:hypothetical protein